MSTKSRATLVKCNVCSPQNEHARDYTSTRDLHGPSMLVFACSELWNMGDWLDTRLCSPIVFSEDVVRKNAGTLLQDGVCRFVGVSGDE